LSAVPQVWRGRVCLTLAMMTVGSTVIASAAARGLDPFVASLLRFGVATPILLAICLVRGERTPRFSRAEWGVVMFQSAVGSLGYTVALVSGLRYASAADAAVVTGLLPVATGSVAVVALGERPGRRLWFAIALAAAGATLVAFGERGGGGSGDMRLLGLFLVFLAVLGEACFALLNKRIATPAPPIVMATLMSAISLVLSLGPGLVGVLRDPGALADVSGVAAMVYYGLVPTVGGFWLWYSGAALTRGAEAAAFTAVAPVTAMLLSVVALHEAMALRHLVGLALVLAAIAVTVTARE
jgi:drug/metabolite transporter (DMT)-like permease